MYCVLLLEIRLLKIINNLNSVRFYSFISFPFMHDHSHNQPSDKGPCLQIMFNINSKNCVNHNIITDMNKPYHLDLNPNDGGSKNDKTVVMSNKKYPHSSNQKSNKLNLNKTTLNSSKPPDFISQ